MEGSRDQYKKLNGAGESEVQRTGLRRETIAFCKTEETLYVLVVSNTESASKMMCSA